MPYRVKAVAQDGHREFRRGGRVFSADEWTVLSDPEMTDAIRNERMLTVEEIAEPESASFAARQPVAKPAAKVPATTAAAGPVVPPVTTEPAAHVAAPAAPLAPAATATVPAATAPEPGASATGTPATAAAEGAAKASMDAEIQRAPEGRAVTPDAGAKLDAARKGK